VVVAGGAVFVPGNVEQVAEFNFYRDAPAAKEVMQSGRRMTLVPLDVTQRVMLDASHVGHFGAADTVYGPMLAEMMSFPMQHGRDAEGGRFIVHDAVAVGALIWPELFMHTRLSVEVDVEGNPPGRSYPARKQDKSKLVSMILSVNEALFIERLMEVLCHERFHT
jgi:inosine-uridine nucleoside N-ribohydrolase